MLVQICDFNICKYRNTDIKRDDGVCVCLCACVCVCVCVCVCLCVCMCMPENLKMNPNLGSQGTYCKGLRKSCSEFWICAKSNGEVPVGFK